MKSKKISDAFNISQILGSRLQIEIVSHSFNLKSVIHNLKLL